MEINFAGKTALVSGAGKGIGRATAKLLAECGANVIALSRTQSDLDSLKEEIPNLKTICVDLANVEEAAQAVDAAGRIDLLVNNAVRPTIMSGLEVSKDEMEKSMLVNTIVPLRFCQIVAGKLMKEGCGGAIVNVSSISAHMSAKNKFPYVCTKAALESITIALAAELAPHKIRVNTLISGTAKTPNVVQYQKLQPGALDPLLGRTPLGRAAEPVEMAQGIVFLLSDKASYITGAHIFSDGGYTIN